MTTVDAVVRMAAGHGLGPFPAAPLEISEELLPAVLARVDAERLVGLLDQALADGALVAEDEIAKTVGEAAVRAHAWTLLVERHHLRVHALLGAAGLEHRFLKGPTVAHRFYDHPGLRPFRDVDVLVRGDDLDAAAAALGRADHRRDRPQLIEGFDARYGKSVTLQTPEGIEVDLHRILASGPFGTVRPPDALWARPVDTVTVGGAALPALDPTAALVHACVHAVTGARTVMSTLRDVAQLAPEDGDRAARELADALGVTACVAEAAARTLDALPGAPEALEDLRRWPVRERERRWLALYDTRAGYTRLSWAALRALPGPSAKARYAVALAWARRQHRNA